MAWGPFTRPGSEWPNGATALLHVVLGHELVARRHVLAIEDLLEMPPNELLVVL